MRNASIRRIASTGLMAAVILLCTFLVRLPVGTTGGYIHAGDGVIYIGAWFLGGMMGAAAAGIGSLLADLMAGAAAYAIPTLLIKVAIAAIYAFIAGSKPGVGRIAVGASVGGIVMTLGYFLFEWASFGFGVALGAVPMNLVQATGGVVMALAGQTALQKVPKVIRLRSVLRGEDAVRYRT